jgi:hypothetical protein
MPMLNWKEEYYLIRLLGSSQEYRVHTSNLTTRKLWHDNNWVALPKVQLIPSNYQIHVVFAQASMLLLMKACYVNYDNLSLQIN